MRKAIALLFIAMLAVPSLGCESCSNSPKSPSSNSSGKCPLDTVKLDACVDLLSGLVSVVIGDNVANQCCPVLQGVAGLDAALCLCTTIRAKLLNLDVLLPLCLQLIASCGLTVPESFQCPSS